MTKSSLLDLMNSWGAEILRWINRKVENPILINCTQDDLVELVENEIVKVLLQPLCITEPYDKNLHDSLENAQTRCSWKLKKWINEGTAVSLLQQDLFLKKYEISCPAAVIEAISNENIIRLKYISILESRSPADKIYLKEWDDYKKAIYEPLLKELKNEFPKTGIHAEFYKKRISKNVGETPNTSVTNHGNPVLLEKAEKLQEEKHKETKHHNKNAILQSPQPRKKVTQDNPKSSTQNVDRTFSSIDSPPLGSIHTNSLVTSSVAYVQDVPAIEQQNLDTLIDNPSNFMNENQYSVTEHEKNVVESSKLENTDLTSIETKDQKDTHTNHEKNLTLLERMTRDAESREQKDAPKSKKEKIQIHYPPIFDKQKWKVYWSNSQEKKRGSFHNMQWRCGSYAKDVVSGTKNVFEVERTTDVNQDFLVVKRDKTKISLIMFDGVSQSRAPRQWAEMLAQVYIELGIKISDFKNKPKKIQKWHSNSSSRWETWIEEEYLPRRNHIPAWRLHNEVKIGHTTFVAVELDGQSVRIANIGDSAVFLEDHSGTLSHVPSKYNHILRPMNISTSSEINLDEIEYLERDIDEIKSLMAVTDSIADYIFGKEDDEQKDRLHRYTTVREKLSKLSHLDYITKQIKLGPANGGWLEDDVTFFTLACIPDHQRRS